MTSGEERFFSARATLMATMPGLPMIGLLVVIVRLTSRGPGVYRQVRVGRGGRTFTMYKLRSMRVDAEVDGVARWASRDDNRSTRVGRLIRKTRLDELHGVNNLLTALIVQRPKPPKPKTRARPKSPYGK